MTNGLSAQIQEIPVFRMNFYLMGMDSLDGERIKLVYSNVEYLNQEFEGQVKFNIGNIHIDPNGAILPDLYKEYLDDEVVFVDELITPIESLGAINVYLFKTVVTDSLGAALQGFTPILRGMHKSYEMASPAFDRIYMAYEGLDGFTTLVHEMGHFLGLKHPWEMGEINLSLLGLEAEHAQEINHMNYSLNVDEFTYEQLVRMNHFALNFRSYLLERVDYIYATSYPK